MRKQVCVRLRTHRIKIFITRRKNRLIQFIILFNFTYITAAFILIGVLMFVGCQSSLNNNLEGDGSLGFMFVLCLLGGLVCVAASVVSGWALKKHLLNPIWDDDDDDDDEFRATDYGFNGVEKTDESLQ